MVTFSYDCPVCGRPACMIDPNQACKRCEKSAKKELAVFLKEHASDSTQQLLEVV